MTPRRRKASAWVARWWPLGLLAMVALGEDHAT